MNRSKKINKKKANELREQLVERMNQQIHELSQRLVPFSEKLRESREKDDLLA